MFRMGARQTGLALMAILAALLLASCGGDDDSAATAPDDAAQVNGEERAEEDAEAGAAETEAYGESEGAESGARPDAAPGRGDRSDADPAPRRRPDSGGGSEQFRVQGGDNSIQDFGAEAEGREFAGAAEALHGFLRARLRSDWAGTCRHISDTIVESFAMLTDEDGLDGDCESVIAAFTEGLPDEALRTAAIADVGSVRVEGDRGFVLYTGAGGAHLAMPVEREDGRWKVAAIGAAPLG